MKKVTKEMLSKHPIVKRLLNNANWAPAAKAAINYYIDGTECPVASWKKSATWAQVKMAYDELCAEDV